MNVIFKIQDIARKIKAERKKKYEKGEGFPQGLTTEEHNSCKKIFVRAFPSTMSHFSNVERYKNKSCKGCKMLISHGIKSVMNSMEQAVFAQGN